MRKAQPDKKTPSLTTGPLSGHIRDIALPLSIGFFFNTMYNVVDAFYAGQVSTSALAAMALSFPVFFIIVAISGGIARGSSVLIANAIGSRDQARESALSGQIYSLGLILSVVITVTGLSLAPTLFRILGATGDYYDLALDYVSPLFWGGVFFILSSLSNSILLAHGDGKTFRNVLIVGFFLNLILDPWFLYGGLGLPPMGIGGIAWATVVIQAASGAYLFSVVLRRRYIQWHLLIRTRPDWNIYKDILHQGLPASFNLMSVALGFFVTTYYLNLYGEAVVAAFGIGTRIEQMALLPAIGLGSAIVSIVGQNNGAGLTDRVQHCVALCIRYGLILIIIGSLILFTFARHLVGLFTHDPEVIEIGTLYIRIMSLIQWAYVMNFIHIGFLQAVKRPLYGFAESVTRKILLPIAIFHPIAAILFVDLTVFWIAMVIINVTMTVITITYAQFVLHRKIGTPTHPAPHLKPAN